MTPKDPASARRSRILVAEDDPGARFVYEELFGVRYDLEFAATTAELRSALKASDGIALLIADLKLADGSFMRLLDDQSFVKQLAMPFIVVSSVDDRDILRLCFAHGALDYWVKPLRANEAAVKVARILGQEGEAPGPFPELRLDPLRLRLTAQGNHAASLTPTEARIVACLLASGAGAATADALRATVWDGARVGRKALDTHLTNLRHKLRKLGFDLHLVTQEGTYLLTRVPYQATG